MGLFQQQLLKAVVRPGGFSSACSRVRDHVVDLRSDTVTKPCDGMRQAIATANVGDDVWGDDPTVNELEARVADLFGKEAAIFAPTGTMTNVLAIGSHCTHRGMEVVAGNRSHIALYEAGGSSVLLGVPMRMLTTLDDGTIDLEEFKDLRLDDDPHNSQSQLVALENTHNTCGGRVLPTNYINEVASICHEQDLLVHVDGARIMNASVALQESPADMTKNVDSVCLCLSKGLGCPAGSVLVGSKTFIHRSRRLRKMLGGGMRQAGVLAAAGMYALGNNVQRLEQDHITAQQLAIGLDSVSGLSAKSSDVDTNLVYFDVDPDVVGGVDLFAAAMEERGVLLCGGYSSTQLRAVTHLGVTSDDIQAAVDAAEEVVASLGSV